MVVELAGKGVEGCDLLWYGLEFHGFRVDDVTEVGDPSRRFQMRLLPVDFQSKTVEGVLYLGRDHGGGFPGPGQEQEASILSN